MLSMKEAAHLTGMAPRSVLRWIQNGDLRAYRLGRSVRIKRADLEKFVDRRWYAESQGTGGEDRSMA